MSSAAVSRRYGRCRGRRRTPAGQVPYARATREPLNAAAMAVPVFLAYHVGLFLTGAGVRNGVDFVTAPLELVARRSSLEYGVMLMALVGIYATVLWALRQRGDLSLQHLVPVLLESLLYAVLLGIVASAVVRNLAPFAAEWSATSVTLDPDALASLLVVSAGAGFYEELVFRVGVLGGTAGVLRRVGLAGWKRAALAVVASALLFSAAHHFVFGSEAFVLEHFVYRTVAGVAFGTIYLARGFAVAVYAHALYDVIALLLAAGSG